MKKRKRIIGCFLIFCIAISLLTGCSSGDKSVAAPVGKIADTSADSISETNKQMGNIEAVSDIQRNSLNMLNYLTVFTEDIIDSKHSRLFLEDAYSSLINNIYPNAVDYQSQNEINALFNCIETLRLIDVKRERLKFEFEQAQAQAVLNAAKNAVGSIDFIDAIKGRQGISVLLVQSVTNVVIDVANSLSDAKMQYLKDGWKLDDAEALLLHNARKDIFNYLITVSRNYDLPGELTLTEKTVEQFIAWKNDSNNLLRIRVLEENQKTYQAFGPYWLTLAEAYYEQATDADISYYKKCLDALAQYEILNVQIFRKDYDYARVLPMVIAAAEYVLPDDEYIAAVEKYAQAILDNTDNGEWALRYFVAQAYMALYARTENGGYLKKAYDIALNNAAYLLTEQEKLNSAYVCSVQKVPVPEDANKEQKKEIAKYNKLLNEERKTALPPVYEPLLINCELLFALAEKLNISAMEAANTDGILHENGNDLFLVYPLDLRFRTGISATLNDKDVAAEFDGDKISLPAQYVSERAKISVSVTQNDETTVIEDWLIDKVDRKEGLNITDFVAIYKSKTAKEVKYADGARILISVLPFEGIDIQPIEIEYRTVEKKTLGILKSVTFQRVEE